MSLLLLLDEGSTLISSSDTATGSEAQSLLTGASSADTGAGADAATAVVALPRFAEQGRERLQVIENASVVVLPGPQYLLPVAFIPHAAVAYGPQFIGAAADAPDPAGEPLGEITVSVWRRPVPAANAPMTKVTDVPEPVVANWQDQVNEPGKGTLVLQNDDAANALIQSNDVIRFAIDGVAAWACFNEERVMVTAHPDADRSHRTSYEGRGLLSVWERMVIYPSRGPGSAPVEEDRIFNYTSPAYDDSEWLPAKVLIPAIGDLFDTDGGPEPNSWPSPLATGHPDPDASVIGPPSGTNDTAPVGNPDPQDVGGDREGGYWYLRGIITIPADGHYVIIAAADNGATIYVDSLQIMSFAEPWYPFPPRQSSEFFASAGPLTIAAQVVNVVQLPPFLPTEHNPTGFVLSLYEAGANGTLGALIGHTDGSWVVSDFPPGPPGMTPTQIVRVVLEEAQARGALLDVSIVCTDGAYADGTPAPLTADISTKVDTDGMTFLRELSATWLDVFAHPTELVFEIYPPGGYGGEVDVDLVTPPSDPDDPATGNITSLEQRERGQ